MEVTQENTFVKYLKHQGDWLEKTRGNLMVVATVIAGMSFQLIVNPPGGVWQEDKCFPRVSQNSFDFVNCRKKVGTAVLQDDETKGNLYISMVITSAVSFSASMNVILLVISGFRLRNRAIMGVLVMLMVVAVLCITAAFYLAMALVHSESNKPKVFVILGFGFLFHGIIVLILVIRFLVWFIRLICICCGRSPANSSM